MLAACCSGDLGFVRRLITEHRECAVRVRDASLRDGNGATALLWACCRNDASVVGWLITTAGCRPEHERGMVHATALMQACMFGHLDVVRWLVSTFAGLLDHVNAYDDTALILACTNGHVHVARWLVSQAGCCVKRERNKYGTSALLAACCVGHLDVVRYLVTEAGSCAKTERNRNGDTALLHACEQGHVDVARWLVAEAGSSIHEKNSVRWCACAGNCCVARGEFTSPREP
jgi:ankyrin repeat protein